MTRIAVITADVLADRMAGPAIRALHIAEELGTRHDVTLISTAECSSWLRVSTTRAPPAPVSLGVIARNSSVC